jgi:cytidine deaminase
MKATKRTAKKGRSDRIDGRRLLAEARKASRRAYAPYSKVRVGAAVLTASGKLFCGCNVENASYGLTGCAERVALQSAVAAGEGKIVAVAVFSPDIDSITPCGACRQVMAEFGGPKGDIKVIMDSERGPRAVPLSELLPYEFRSPKRPR